MENSNNFIQSNVGLLLEWGIFPDLPSETLVLSLTELCTALPPADVFGDYGLFRKGMNNERKPAGFCVRRENGRKWPEVSRPSVLSFRVITER